MGKVAYSRSADSRHLLPEWRRAFCDVRDPAKSVIIELDDDYCDALIVEVDDPLFAAEQNQGEASQIAIAIAGSTLL